MSNWFQNYTFGLHGVHCNFWTLVKPINTTDSLLSTIRFHKSGKAAILNKNSQHLCIIDNSTIKSQHPVLHRPTVNNQPLIHFSNFSHTRHSTHPSSFGLPKVETVNSPSPPLSSFVIYNKTACVIPQLDKRIILLISNNNIIRKGPEQTSNSSTTENIAIPNRLLLIHSTFVFSISHTCPMGSLSPDVGTLDSDKLFPSYLHHAPSNGTLRRHTGGSMNMEGIIRSAVRFHLILYRVIRVGTYRTNYKAAQMKV